MFKRIRKFFTRELHQHIDQVPAYTMTVYQGDIYALSRNGKLFRIRNCPIVESVRVDHVLTLNHY